MSHLLVFADFLILGVGFVAVYQGIQVYREYRYPAMRSFMIFFAVSNLMDLLSLLSQYLVRNVNSLTSDGMFMTIFIIVAPIGFSLGAIEIAFFASTVWHLSGMARAPRWSVYGFGSICLAWVSATCFGFHRFFQMDDTSFLPSLYDWSTLAVIALFTILPLVLLINSRSRQPGPPRRMIRMLGSFFVSLSCLEICALFLPSTWENSIIMLSEFVMNLSLLIFLKPFVMNYYRPLTPSPDVGFSLNRVCSEFHLTARERDLLQLILNGKSNKDIEQELFISPHTVKNHIYNIFRKTGIQRRGQLVRIVLRSSALLSGQEES
jgi:DNA-binding CsgD family transcriptional regulator